MLNLDVVRTWLSFCSPRHADWCSPKPQRWPRISNKPPPTL